LKDYSTSSTFSGGRPSAALLPETTIGRSTMMGCFAIAATLVFRQLGQVDAGFGRLLSADERARRHL
jgi:hypothetical protein